MACSLDRSETHVSTEHEARSTSHVDGVLVVDKPSGPTSHDVVAFVRRTLKTTKVGHTGTLDPLATGVLPLVIGRATRLARFLSSDDKEYVASVRFGAASETYDAEGPIVERAAPACTRAAIEAALPAFRGTFAQTPPPYSAKKVEGTRAYALARKQRPVAIAPVTVEVASLDLLEFADGVARLRIVSSSGFYVRSLAHDLGEAIGCGAYLQGLRRTRAGAFGERDAVTLDALQDLGPDAGGRIIPMDRLLSALPAVRLTEEGLRRAAHGNEIRPRDVTATVDGAGPMRLLGPDEGLVAVAERGAGGVLRPTIVLV
jgi:tRNA pseudouridine55 synthase